MRRIFITALFLLTGQQAVAACTPQDVDQKATELFSILQSRIHNRDDQIAVVRVWRGRLSAAEKTIIAGLTPTDFSIACREYDKLISDARKKN